MKRYFGEDKPSLEGLVHHGVKGMHWGVHKSAEDIKSARDRHNELMNKIENHAIRLSLAKSKAEKQRHLDQIHKLADEGLKSGDTETSTRMTRGEKIISNFLGGPIGYSFSRRGLKKQKRIAEQYLNAYKNSNLEDYHDANNG